VNHVDTTRVPGAVARAACASTASAPALRAYVPTKGNNTLASSSFVNLGVRFAHTDTNGVARARLPVLIVQYVCVSVAEHCDSDSTVLTV
jgi:hypothetical protein